MWKEAFHSALANRYYVVAGLQIVRSSRLAMFPNFSEIFSKRFSKFSRGFFEIFRTVVFQNTPGRQVLKMYACLKMLELRKVLEDGLFKPVWILSWRYNIDIKSLWFYLVVTSLWMLELNVMFSNCSCNFSWCWMHILQKYYLSILTFMCLNSREFFEFFVCLFWKYEIFQIANQVIFASRYCLWFAKQNFF